LLNILFRHYIRIKKYWIYSFSICMCILKRTNVSQYAEPYLV
jgi:hypothetical protein